MYTFFFSCLFFVLGYWAGYFGHKLSNILIDKIKLTRIYNKRYAGIHGFFWTKCPLCSEYFGGHEWKDVDGHRSSILVGSAEKGTAICQTCTKQCELLETLDDRV